MRPRPRNMPRRAAAAAALAVAAAGAVATAAPGSAATAGQVPRPARSLSPASGGGAGQVRPACPPAPRQGRCYALYAPQATVGAALAAQAAGQPAAAGATTPKGWGATHIEQAYKLPVRRAPDATPTSPRPRTPPPGWAQR